MPIPSSPIEKGAIFEGKKVLSEKKVDFILEEPMYSFEDMIISNELKEEIDNAISIFRYRSKLFEEWNIGKVVKKPYLGDDTRPIVYEDILHMNHLAYGAAVFCLLVCAVIMAVVMI